MAADLFRVVWTVPTGTGTELAAFVPSPRTEALATFGRLVDEGPELAAKYQLRVLSDAEYLKALARST